MLDRLTDNLKFCRSAIGGTFRNKNNEGPPRGDRE